MKSQVFINLPVTNLEKSAALYTKMGFTINPAFSDNSAKCLVWSEEIFLMIMTTDRFKTFATRPLADTKNGLAGIYALSVSSLAKVNEVAGNALAAGATEPKPLQDHGFMQLRTIEDADGHTWEIFFMDMTKLPQQ
jgi:predicted lactoylglutathione lyase